MKTVEKLIKRPFLKLQVALVVLVLFVGLLDYYGSSDSEPEYPDYDMVDLGGVVNIENIYQGHTDETTMEVVFCQTGLGEEAIEEIALRCENSSEFLEILENYQNQLFFGKETNRLVNLEDGDVLVSMSQRLCFYPHGHAAIVVNSAENEILEAKSYTVGSCMGTTEKWSKISSFVVLRVKEEVAEKYDNPAPRAALYAKENLDGLKYSLFKDIRVNREELPEYTQCAHLVWYAYYVCGLDIDENRGVIVKPKDFLQSDVFEVVQVFGINPKSILELRNE